MKINPLLLTDGYKTGHHQQYPKGTTLVYSNFTPRSNKYAPKGCDKVVSFGQQMIMKQIHEAFQNEFFSKPKDEVCGEMKRELSMYLGTDYDVTHFEKLHDLGYLPINVKVIEEGTLVPIKVPILTIYNTHPDFFWVTNYLETIISNLLWKPTTSATIAHQYRKVLTKWQEKTDKERAWFVDWQGHDFSMRGMDSIDATISSGLGHLTSFSGTDSLPAIGGARKYYGETGFVGGSVNATEHSVMCAGGKEDEIETFRRLLQTYPTGILSVVSDTWDLWKVCTEHVLTLKEEILARDGKLVIRPDSGDPVDIICGEFEPYRVISKADIDKPFVLSVGQKFMFTEESPETNQQYYTKTEDGYVDYVYQPKHKGVIELLWDIFGGTINEQGYKVLDPHIGAIYGDSITIDRAEEICSRLEAKGFASTNIVLGVGSFTYQYNTRDTFGFAMKATYVELEVPKFGEFADQGLNTEIIGREIFKDPITDDGTKKSATGLLKVVKTLAPDSYGNLHTSGYTLVDKVSWDEENIGELKTIYKDGEFHNITTLTEIKNRLK
jgi:nicotinamide phosphoribosyltransferase